MCTLLLLLFALLAIGPSTGDVTLSFNGQKGLLSAPLPVEYASFNIDSASLGYLFDFKDIRLRNLVKQISKPGAFLRIGGTASASVAFTGVNGRRNSCPGHICINAEYWDEIADFVAYTGVRLLFDFSGNWFNGKGDWDPTLNVTSQLAYTLAKGYGKDWAWEMGNEDSYGHTAIQWGEYFNNLKKTLAQYPGIGQTLSGSSSAIRGTSTDDFLRTTKGNLDIFSYHRYGPDVKPLSMNNIKKSDLCSGLRKLVDSIVPGVLVALEESGCAPIGGHDGICNRFIDGFYWIHALTGAAETGCHILHRQDVVGFSFPGLGSSYALAGPPGWFNSSLGELNPHPDWFTLVLFKQLVGLMPLGNVSLSGNGGEIDDLDPHVWCGSKKGSVVFVYSNAHASDVHLTSVSGLMLTPRTEYILTAPSLTADEIYLNGKKMTVGEDGMLPEYPIPGSLSTTTPLVLPSFSYGFIEFSGNVIACA